MYIGPQGIVHGTYITLLNAGRLYLGTPVAVSAGTDPYDERATAAAAPADSTADGPHVFWESDSVAVVFYLIWVPPTGLGEMVIFAWLLGFGLLARLVNTVYIVPHLALGAELTALLGHAEDVTNEGIVRAE